MPRELTSAEESAWNRYQALGTVDEIENRIKKLRTESAKYRTKSSELEEKLKGAPAVPDGGKVLTKDEATRFDAFEATKLKPDAIQAVVTERDQLKSQLAAKDRETSREAAAKTLGIEGKDLAPFAGADALTYEVKEEEVTENGKTEKRSVAYVKDAEGKELKLAEYGKEKWGRPFEAVLGAPAKETTTTTRYTTQTDSANRRDGKVTEEDRRKSVEKTADYNVL